MANVTIGATQTSGKTTGASTITLSHTIDSGSDGILLVRIAHQATFSSVTAGGAGMTLIRNDNSGGFETRCYYLSGLSSGAISVVATFSGVNFAAAVASNFYNVDTSNVVNASATTATGGQVGSVTLPITTTVDGCMIADMVMGNNSPNTPVGTLDAYQSDGASNRAGYFQHFLKTPAGATSADWTLNGGTFTGSTAIAINPKPVAAAGNFFLSVY